MKHGTRATHADERDYSQHRTFGTIAPADLPLEFSVDRDRPVPDQNADGLPQACTGYTTTDIASNDDDTIYDPRYTYEKTCMMEGHDTNQPCDIRTSLESASIYGLRVVSDPKGDPLKYRRGPYFQIWDDGGLDWYDGVRSTIKIHHLGVSVGLPWFPEWDAAARSGDTIMLDFYYSGRPKEYSWHDIDIVGWVLIKNIPYLRARVWQGTQYGVRGYVHFSRPIINKALAISGTFAATQPKFRPEHILTIKLTMFRYCLVYMSRMIGLKLYN